MTTNMKPWGNSMGLRIPKNIISDSNLSVHDSLEIIAFDGGFTIKKETAKKFSDISKPLLDTKNFVFDREDANER